jgi:cell division protein FtsW (lipid II flippase)
MKRYYEDEKIHGWSNFLLSILIVLFIISMYGCFKEKVPIEISIMLVIFLSIFILVFLYFIITNIMNAKWNRKKVELFINKGTKVPGVIIKEEHSNKLKYKNTIFKKAEYYGKGIFINPISYRYSFFEVEYEYNGKKQTTITPPIDFYPEYLIDKNVDVYVYNDECYVGNYNIDYEKIKKDEEEFDVKKWMIVFLVIYLVFSTGSFLLYSYRIIDDQTIEYTALFMGVSFVIAGCIACHRNYTKVMKNKKKNKNDV